MNMEGMPNPERVERHMLVEALKANGFEDEATLDMLVAWTKEGEERAMAEGTRKAQAEFELDRAALYEDAGRLDLAREALDDVLLMLDNEGEDPDLDAIASKARYQLSLLG